MPENPPQQVGIAGKAPWRGIPVTTVSWTNSPNPARTLEIFTEIQKSPLADRGATKDISNETVAMARSDKRIVLRFSAKPVSGGTSIKPSDALVIGADLPEQLDPVTIVCTSDPQVAGTAYIDDIGARYSPEGELVVDITATKYLNLDKTAKNFVTLTG